MPSLADLPAAAASSASGGRGIRRLEPIGSSHQHSTAAIDEQSVEDNALRVFASYLPASLVLRYAASAEPKPPEQPEREDFEAVVCFLDVSGFTALSERLARPAV